MVITMFTEVVPATDRFGKDCWLVLCSMNGELACKLGPFYNEATAESAGKMWVDNQGD